MISIAIWAAESIVVLDTEELIVLFADFVRKEENSPYDFVGVKIWFPDHGLKALSVILL